MRLRIPTLSGQNGIFSLAYTDDAHQDLLEEMVEHLYVHENCLEFFPANRVVMVDSSIVDQLSAFNDYDAVEVHPDGSVYRCYDDKATENVFFVTGKCNSNCIMCPTPEYTRRNSDDPCIARLIELASHMSVHTPHITVTGGEPFLAGKDIFGLFGFCRSKFPDTEFLVLTNGRVFALKEYCELLKETAPDNTILGIPIHGSCAVVHDAITRTPGSFNQTISGLQNLHNLGVRLELRIVVCRMNITDLANTARLIASVLPNAERVCIMGMEMTGNAHVNRDMVWIPYQQSAPFVAEATDVLIGAGIDVRLYNYPLCTVDHKYWTICYKSITDHKIRYAQCCENCSVKDACGGVFAGTFSMVKDELKPI